MVIKECKFDPVKDLKSVEQFGFVDLKDALVNGLVPSTSPDGETDYNGISEPKSILGTPSDVFDALRMQNDLDNYKKSAEGEYNKE